MSNGSVGASNAIASDKADDGSNVYRGTGSTCCMSGYYVSGVGGISFC